MIEHDEFSAEEQAQMRTLELVERNSKNCTSCEAPIIWATTARRGKAIPLDAIPAPTPGMGQFKLRAAGSKLVADYIDRHEQRMREQSNKPGGHVSHFSSCPNATEHRKSER